MRDQIDTGYARFSRTGRPLSTGSQAQERPTPSRDAGGCPEFRGTSVTAQADVMRPPPFRQAFLGVNDGPSPRSGSGSPGSPSPGGTGLGPPASPPRTNAAPSARPATA